MGRNTVAHDHQGNGADGQGSGESRRTVDGRGFTQRNDFGAARSCARGSIFGTMQRFHISTLALLIAFIGTIGWAFGGEAVQAASLKPPVSGSGSGAGASGAGSGFVPSRASGSWEALFQLVQGETYTYKLTHDMTRNARWSTDYELHRLRPAPNHKPQTAGELNFSLVGRRDEIRFWFDIDGVRGNGTAPNDVRALAGAVLVAALTGPEPLSAEGLRLLATPFQWMQWYDSFAMSTFRDGVVWRVSEHPPHRFTATPYSGRTRFWGELTRGRDVILEMGVDLREPLPWDVIARDGWNVYRAELEPVSGIGRRR